MTDDPAPDARQKAALSAAFCSAACALPKSIDLAAMFTMRLWLEKAGSSDAARIAAHPSHSFIPPPFSLPLPTLVTLLPGRNECVFSPLPRSTLYELPPTPPPSPPTTPPSPLAPPPHQPRPYHCNPCAEPTRSPGEDISSGQLRECLRTFLKRTLQHTRLSTQCLFFALLLLVRLKRASSARRTSPHPTALFRILGVAISLADIVFNDLSVPVQTWTNVMELALHEVVKMKAEFLQAVGFDLSQTGHAGFLDGVIFPLLRGV
ncbi:hypothetical protein BDK51DRAFT_32940 [Blyttiomyces helicus]|uniref:Cyclin N-terminal domain-containing protein n=1 Tax=Blyttiomyces helicus TaxID=388810 RepID=A0A4P9WQ05_9FUNG|nr:hypothetical protein BDK51DRAFT_32940 [Blyttiomyces helicus]|eukprot:RKO93858.1 hypothetical protein BDK51DRAFT_32940 [Blyttiomyces helicus]